MPSLKKQKLKIELTLGSTDILCIRSKTVIFEDFKYFKQLEIHLVKYKLRQLDFLLDLIFLKINNNLEHQLSVALKRGE